MIFADDLKPTENWEILPPVDCGYYWLICNGKNPKVVQVIGSQYRGFARNQDRRIWMEITPSAGLWFGPLRPPPVPELRQT